MAGPLPWPLTINGGIWDLTGANSYTGGTLLTSGTLVFGASSVNSGTGPIGSGMLSITGSNVAIFAAGGAQSIANLGLWSD